MAEGKEQDDIGFRPIYSLTNESTAEEVKNVYRSWAENYEKDLQPSGYLGIFFTVSEFCHALCEHNIHLDGHIVDVGAGTGLVGQHLSQLGYSNVDAFDISQEMLDAAKKKNIYQKFICDGLGLGSNALRSMSYDGAISSACFTLGHMKAPAIQELAMMVRKGGIVAFNARQDTIEDETHSYNKVIQQLESDGVWKVLVKRKIDYFLYPYGDQRARYCYLFVCQRL